MKFIISLLIFFFSLQSVYNWRIRHHGRSVGGNLGEPRDDNSKLLQKILKGKYERWFTQNLDHFNPTIERTWQQRYFANDEFFDKTARKTVFLMIGGEGEASEKWMTQGAWIDYAKKYEALCFQVEHRYYGKSHPTTDVSTKNLQWLTSQQALADLAVFIEYMNEKYQLSSNVKWIVFGGSYPGSLAAWMRQKYPHLVHGAMSASGPLLAQVDFQEYFEVVDEDLRTHSDECLKAVQMGSQQIKILLKHMVGQRNLNNLFRLCDPVEHSIKNSRDISNLFETLSGNFAEIAQYNKDNRVGKNNQTSNITVDTLCDIMVNQSIGAQVHRLAVVNDLILNSTNQTCLDYKYDEMIENMRNISWDSEMSEGGRQWTYQTCTEFGFFQTSSFQPQVFGDSFPVDFYIQQCTDIFGPKYGAKFLEKAVDRTNTLYGALSIEATNVVFVHGSVDPWHALGITKTINQGAPAIYIKGTAHCANMYPKSDEDLPDLMAARVMIESLIGTWLDQP